MKVIFLDIDGVLNTNDYMAQRVLFLRAKNGTLEDCMDKYGHVFDPRAVKWLEYIIIKTGAKIVVSSTWRSKGMAELTDMWRDRDLPGEVINITKNCYHYPNKMKGTDKERWRGGEIDLFLEEHPEVQNYVIIDDDKDMLKEQKNNFVHVKPDFGLWCNAAEKAIRILNTQRDITGRIIKEGHILSWDYGDSHNMQDWMKNPYYKVCFNSVTQRFYGEGIDKNLFLHDFRFKYTKILGVSPKEK